MKRRDILIPPLKGEGFKFLKRREFIALLGGAAAVPAVLPSIARAQQRKPVVGFLSLSSASHLDIIEAVRQGLREAGFVEGSNYAFDFALAEGRIDRLSVLAADLVGRKVNVIVALGATVSVAVKAATTTVPVVFYMGEDPVSLGIVSSFNRPGGNLTGVATLSSAVVAKRLALLRELAPRAGGFAALINPKNPYSAISTKEVQDAGRALGRDIRIVHVASEGEIDGAFATLARLKTGALLIVPDALFILHSGRIATLAARHQIAASHERRAFPDAGGLMSYGSNQSDGMRLAGTLAGRVLKGAKPAEMPVMQPTKFELVINGKAAKALGLTIPPTLLAIADEVIE